MSAWAKPGVKCVCVGGWSRGWRSDDGKIEIPATRQTYTIREVHPNGDAIRLVEIVNPPLPYLGETTECWFRIERFRPLVSQQDDIATHFAQYLKTDHRATRKQGEDA